MRAIHGERCPACGQALYETNACAMCDWTSDKTAEKAPGYLWELADDRCQECGAFISRGIRWLHVRLCDRCRRRPKH